jgi:hypothetical protein
VSTTLPPPIPDEELVPWWEWREGKRPKGWVDVGELFPAAEPALQVRTARELCALPDPPASDELLGPVLVRGSRTIVGAHTGEGKTEFALRMLGAVVAGGEFLDWRGQGGARALFVDAEQGLRTVKRRLREAGLSELESVDYLHVPDGLALDSDEQQIADLEELLGRGDYAIVALDPAYKLARSLDSNVERSVVELMRRFDAWRTEYHFALLLPVHLRKPIPGERFSIHDVFGSGAYVRGAEVVLGLRRVSNGFAELHFFKDRDGDLEVGDKWGLLFDREYGFRRAPDDVEQSEAELAEQLLEYVRENPGSSTTRVTESVKGRRTRLVQILRGDDRFHSEKRGQTERWFATDSLNPVLGDGTEWDGVSGADPSTTPSRGKQRPVGTLPTGRGSGTAASEERET